MTSRIKMSSDDESESNINNSVGWNFFNISRSRITHPLFSFLASTFLYVVFCSLATIPCMLLKKETVEDYLLLEDWKVTAFFLGAYSTFALKKMNDVTIVCIFTIYIAYINTILNT